MIQLPVPPYPPGIIPPPFNFFDFVCLYLVVLESVLLALPCKIANQILETLFPILRRPLFSRNASLLLYPRRPGRHDIISALLSKLVSFPRRAIRFLWNRRGRVSQHRAGRRTTGGGVRRSTNRAADNQHISYRQHGTGPERDQDSPS